MRGVKLRMGLVAAVVASCIAAPAAVASDDPVRDSDEVTCLAMHCTDPGWSPDDGPPTDGDDQGDAPGDAGDPAEPGDGGSGGTGDGDGSDGSGGDGGDAGDPTDPGDGGSDGSGDGDKPDIDLCAWEPWNCNGGDPTEPPRCKPMANGTKICVTDPPFEPNCKIDPDTGEESCWTPPDLCLVARFATEADAAEAGCLPPSCVITAAGTVDCGGGGEPECPDCVTPYPPPCDWAENEKGEVFCGEPLTCFVDDAGNKACPVYDFGGGGSSDSGEGGGEEKPDVGICLIGVKSPCNGDSGTDPRPTTGGKPTPRKPVVKKPAPRKPVVRKPASKKPAVTKPAPKKPAARKPATRPAPNKPATKPAPKKPVARKPATKPAPKKPTARKPAAKKPAPKKPATRQPSSSRR